MRRLLHLVTCSTVLFLSACDKGQEAAIETEHDLFARFIIRQVIQSERIAEEEALKYFELEASRDGDPVNHFMVGFIHEHGLYGVPQDYEAAAIWYERAANRDVFRAQFKLGTLYYKGKGVPKDYTKAYMWLNLAAASGGEATEDAAKYRDIVAKAMTLEQIAEGQRAATIRSSATLDELIAAVRREDVVMVTKLLGEGAPVRMPDKDGRTPLHYADSIELIGLLLDHGADINARTSNKGLTRLHQAVADAALMPEQLAVVKFLLDRGADVNIRDRNGTTPLDFAAIRRNSPVRRLLEERGAKLGQFEKRGL